MATKQNKNHTPITHQPYIFTAYSNQCLCLNSVVFWEASDNQCKAVTWACLDTVLTLSVAGCCFISIQGRSSVPLVWMTNLDEMSHPPSDELSL